MVESIRVALGQMNPVVGDLLGNRSKITEAYRTALADKAQIVVFPQLALCGVPPQDLLLRRDFLGACKEHLIGLAEELQGDCIAVVGSPYPVDTSEGPKALDAAAVIRGGMVEAIVARSQFSANSILDDSRYFSSIDEVSPQDMSPQGVSPQGVSPQAVSSDRTVIELGAVRSVIVLGEQQIGPSIDPGSFDLVIRLTASMFYRGVQAEREASAQRESTTQNVPVAVVNLVGAQDEVIFDGGSVCAAEGRIIHRSTRFVESLDVFDLPVVKGDRGVAHGQPAQTESADSQESTSELWSALVLGINDYVTKNGFNSVGLGLSGGVDSALVAALAVDALGAEKVHAVLMPSRYSSDSSVIDATALAENLRIEARTIPIEPAHRAFEEMLSESFEGHDADLTEENLQARVRGTTLMALSNKFGWLIMVTGNKSESTVGYSTLYGDSAGGLAPIQDVDKQTVYELCRWYNSRCVASGDPALIPESILTKAPSAELRPGQRDDQSLPPYPELDPIIDAYVEGGLTRAELVGTGADPELVDRVIGLVQRSEYKRRQSPPGFIVTKRTPGYRRLLPITRKSTGWSS